MPLPYPVWLLYLVPLWLASRLGRRGVLVSVAAICSSSIGLGAYFALGTPLFGFDLPHRILGVALIWTAASAFSPDRPGSTSVLPAWIGLTRPTFMTMMSAVLLVAFIAIASFRTLAAYRDSLRWVMHTHEVRNALAELLSAIKDAETGQRGFLLTGDERFLASYNAGRASVDQLSEHFTNLIEDNLLQQQRFARLQADVSNKLRDMSDNIRTRRESGLDAAIGKVASGYGQDVMQSIRSTVAEMDHAEHQLLQQRGETLKLIAGAMTMYLALGGLMLGGLVVASIGLIRREQAAQRALTALAEQARFYADNIIDTVRDPLIVLDSDQVVQRANRAFFQLFGSTAEEVEGRRLSDLGDGQWNIPELRQLLEQVIPAHTTVEGFEIEHSFAQIGRRTLVINARKLFRPGNNTNLLLLAIEDVTERKNAQQEILRLNADLERRVEARTLQLSRNEAQLRTIVEHLSEGLAVADLDGHLLHFNRAALDMHGFGGIEESRRHLSEFGEIFELATMDGTPLPIEQWPLARVLRGETLRGWEVQIRRCKSDWQRIFSYGGTLVRDADGQPLLAVVTISDITERKRIDAEIRRLNAELEERVRRRTAELEGANRELEAFSYSVSHDLRAPLRHIEGFVKLLAEREQGRLDDTSTRYLRTIAAAAAKMSALIDDLLAFSRTGRAELRVQPVSLSRLLEEARQEVTVEPAERDIRWHIAPLPVVMGDPALLRQLWINLLSNAVKYTRQRPEAHIEVFPVPAGVQLPPGLEVVAVRDNGAGFDPGYAHKLFGVFQRLHRAEEFEGTGVGLATVRRIVERHGGQVWAEGAVDHGATFYVALPTAGKDGDALC